MALKLKVNSRTGHADIVGDGFVGDSFVGAAKSFRAPFKAIYTQRTSQGGRSSTYTHRVVDADNRIASAPLSSTGAAQAEAARLNAIAQAQADIVRHGLEAGQQMVRTLQNMGKKPPVLSTKTSPFKALQASGAPRAAQHGGRIRGDAFIGDSGPYYVNSIGTGLAVFANGKKVSVLFPRTRDGSKLVEDVARKLNADYFRTRGQTRELFKRAKNLPNKLFHLRGDSFVGAAKKGIGTALVQKITDGQFSKLSSIGLVFDKGLDTATYTDPVPAKFRVIVYQLMQNRSMFGEGAKFWQKDTDFMEETADQAATKAKAYIDKQGWKFAPFSQYAGKTS